MKENKIIKLLCSRPFLYVLLLMLIWMGIVLARTMYKKSQLDNEISNLKGEIQKMDSRGQELAQLMEYFNSKSYLEKEAKEKLNLKKEGETVVMVPEAAIAGDLAGASVPSKASESKHNHFVEWWEFFFRK